MVILNNRGYYYVPNFFRFLDIFEGWSGFKKLRGHLHSGTFCNKCLHVPMILPKRETPQSSIIKT